MNGNILSKLLLESSPEIMGVMTELTSALETRLPMGEADVSSVEGGMVRVMRWDLRNGTLRIILDSGSGDLTYSGDYTSSSDAPGKSEEWDTEEFSMPLSGMLSLFGPLAITIDDIADKIANDLGLK